MTSQDDAMFRITSHIDGDEIVLTVEGCLMGAWVHELDACWMRAAAWLPGRRIRVDLSDVWHVDDAGTALMTAMYRAGVDLVTKGCVMPEIVREIAEAIDAPRRN
jgi:ABC-type transporter Mla MlaB component